jgi:adenylate kinase family enzyme
MCAQGSKRSDYGDCNWARVIVIGSSGSGKTTFAGQFAAILGVPHIELDAVFWLPNWTHRDRDEFRQLVAQAVSKERWVADGNYSAVRDILWSRATAAVWLNYPFILVFWRVFKRTVTRVVHREELFSGNRESVRKAFMSRESLLWWVIRSYSRRRRQYRSIFDGAVYPGVSLVEFKKPEQAQEFLESRLVHRREMC